MAEIAAVNTRPPSKYWPRVHLLPQPPDFARIAAEQKLPVVPYRPHDGELSSRQPRLSPAVDAFVGLYLDDELIARWPTQVG